jgi:gas vesicle protein
MSGVSPIKTRIMERLREITEAITKKTSEIESLKSEYAQLQDLIARATPKQPRKKKTAVRDLPGEAPTETA